MVSAFLFYIHILFMLIIFTKKWQTESLSTAFLHVALIGLIFSIGWSITGMVATALFAADDLSFYFDRDAFSLTLLTLLEFFFYRFFYNDIVNEAGTERQ